MSRLSKIIRSVGFLGLYAAIVLAVWILCLPFLWVVARFFPRRKDRVIFWTNQGFNVAPSRVRSYFICREFIKQGGNGRVLSFWDHILDYHGLLPVDITLAQRSLVVFKAVGMVIRDRAGVIVAQAPLYDVIGLASLRFLYPWDLRIWTDFDDWLFEEVSLDGCATSVNLRDVLPLHMFSSTGCLVSSLELEQEMKKYFKRVEIIPTFCDKDMFCPKSEEQQWLNYTKVRFTWTGTFLMKHVVDDVIFIIQALQKVGDERVALEVVGDGHFLEDAKQKTERLAPTLDVSYRGWMNPQDMPEYLQGIDVGLYCLTKHDRFTASKSPTKLFEYMACAKPTVSTRFGEAVRFVEHGITGFLASDMDQFAKYSRRLVEDPELRKQMGENARERIETKFNMTEGVKKLERTIMNSSTA